MARLNRCADHSAPPWRALLRDRAHSQQNNGFVSFAYLTPFLLSQMVLFKGITSRPSCQLIFFPEAFLLRRYLASNCWSASA